MSTHASPSFRLLRGDCLRELRSLPDASIDSIVTDPPYEIGFMGRAWDSTGIAYQVDLWRECLRVLKPGGHLLAFGATRSYHRMTVAIEDAGFEIRDSIHWTYGSGFPKSLDVSKAIDKAAGAERKVVGSKRVSPKGVKAAETRSDTAAGSFGGEAKDVPVTAPATSDAATWQGWGTALKPSHEPIVVARRPLVGTVAQTVLAHGTGALNIDACRVGSEERTYDLTMTSGNFESTGGGKNVKSGTATVSGRWPANTVLTHAAGCRATGETKTESQTYEPRLTHNTNLNDDGWRKIGAKAELVERTTSVPVFACVPGCPIAQLDQQSGERPGGNFPSERGKSVATKFASGKQPGDQPSHKMGDSGGASRFFTCTEWSDTWDAPAFLYVAKPAKKERNAGLGGLPEKPTSDAASSVSNKRCKKCGLVKFAQPHCTCAEPEWETTATGAHQNHHPTVKPVALMRHLVRLVTPPGGVVLDPFLGSGTTAVAGILEGFHVIGCEMTEDYYPIIDGRVAHAVAEWERLHPDVLL